MAFLSSEMMLYEKGTTFHSSPYFQKSHTRLSQAVSKTSDLGLQNH